jgi:hypothetical protein
MVERTEERWKALRAWFGQEFPKIAAGHAPNGDQQDRTGPPHSGVAGKGTRRKGKTARKRSALGQVQPSKVSKPRQRRRRPLNQKVWPPEGHANDVEVQGPPKVAVRKSERICQPCPGLDGAAEKCSDATLRRSERILNLDVGPARSSTTAGRKSTRRTGTLRGVSKRRSKGKNV